MSQGIDRVYHMKLTSHPEVDNTRLKLNRLESSFARLMQEEDEDPELCQEEIQSLARLIKQLKEEIAWFEATRRETANQ